MTATLSVVCAQTFDINALRQSKTQPPILDMGYPTVKRETQTQHIHLMDKPVDKTQYIIGPGDQFQVNIISSAEESTLNLVVSPTGEILIPSVGVISLNSHTLENGINAIRAEIQSWNKNAKIHITLSQIREFKVKVIGHLQKPGLYTVTPVSRVSDLFEEINADEQLTEPSPEYQSKHQASSLLQGLTYPDLSRRNIILIRQGDSLQVDLAKFSSTGQDQFNPFIHQGDIIVFPLKQVISSIYGGVNIPGDYEYSPNESLFEFIQLAGGLRPDADPDKIEITRFRSNTEKYTFSTSLKEGNKIIVESGDHVMVRYQQDFKRQEVISIIGEVQFPGVYTIGTQTTLKHILDKSGGYTRKADPSKIQINNQAIKKIPDRELKRINLIPEENRSLAERAYIKARALTQKGTIESNSQGQTNALMDFILVNNDQIYVPENFNFIEVLGGVLEPGRYPFNSELTYQDYIDLAGGKTQNATRNIYIIKAGTGQRLPAKQQVKIENGDTIFIADKIEFNRWIVLKDILTTLGQVAALIVVIQSAQGS